MFDLRAAVGCPYCKDGTIVVGYSGYWHETDTIMAERATCPQCNRDVMIRFRNVVEVISVDKAEGEDEW